MQIHELDTFIGTTSESTYLAIDDGTETNKIPATDVGITTEMTTSEAETGTGTEPRVITPAVLNAYVNAKATAIAQEMYITETVAIGSGTITGGGGTAEVTADVSKTGYTPIGIVGIKKTGQTYATVVLSRFSLTNTTATVTMYNNNASSRTFVVEATILYRKA